MADTEDNNLETPELTIDSVVAIEPTELSADQTTFLKDNADSLTEEQKETYKSVLTPEEVEEEIDIDKIIPESRREKAEAKKEEDKDEDDTEVDPDDAKTIGKVVKKELAPVAEALKELQIIKDQNEVDSFIRSNPTYDKYRVAALKYMAHPAYANVPAKNIMAIVSASDMQKLGAQKERMASAKAKETQGGGNQARTQTGGKTDYKNMSSEDFNRVKQEAIQGGRQ